MTFCSNCKHQIIENSKFCTNCGVPNVTPITNPNLQRPVSNNSPKPKKQSKEIIIGTIITLGLLATFLYLFYQNNSDTISKTEDSIAAQNSNEDEASKFTPENLLQIGIGGFGEQELAEISQLTEQFYKAENEENLESILNFFEYPIHQYYENYQVNYAQLKSLFQRSFNGKLLSHKIQINWNESYVDKMDWGYLIRLKANYTYVTYKRSDLSKSRPLSIRIVLNQNKKITSVYEVK